MDMLHFPEKSLLLVSNNDLPASLEDALKQSGWVLYRVETDRLDNTREMQHTLILVYCVDDPLVSGTLQPLIRFAAELPLVFIVENISDEHELALYRHGSRSVFHADSDPKDLLQILNREYNSRFRNWQESNQLFQKYMESGVVIGASRFLHDLTSPFTPVQNYLDLVEMEGGKSPEIPIKDDDPWKMLFDGVESMGSLIDSWQRYLMTCDISLGEIDLLKVIKSAIHSGKMRFPGIRFTIEYQGENEQGSGFPNEIRMEGDSFLLQEVFLRFFQNSFESRRDDEPLLIRIDLESRQHRTLVRVTDNGKGVDKSIRIALWKDFVTTKSEKGAGLGLGIARYLLSLHGASAQLKETGDEGTCIEILFRQ